MENVGLSDRHDMTIWGENYLDLTVGFAELCRALHNAAYASLPVMNSSGADFLKYRMNTDSSARGSPLSYS
jgi:hypothetical protein